jgi:sugar phosphate isomerase/epimerase
LFPTDPKRLGREVPIGEGKVDWPKLIQRLRALNYRGAMTIEREISGPRQVEDVKKAITFLERLLS